MKRRTVRRLAWVGVALCLVALAFGVTARLLDPPPEVTEENLRRIQPGMTQADVERILGRAVPWKVDEAELSPETKAGCGFLPEDRWEMAWDGSDGMAVVRFSADGKVTYSCWEANPDVPAGSPLDRLRSLLGR